MKTHVLSSSIKGVTSKFVPKRDGPYLIHKKVSPTTYLLAYPETPDKPIGKYHISDLKRYHAREDACSNVPEPVIPKRRRGRPRKIPIIQRKPRMLLRPLVYRRQSIIIRVYEDMMEHKEQTAQHVQLWVLDIGMKPNLHRNSVESLKCIFKGSQDPRLRRRRGGAGGARCNGYSVRYRIKP
ncbi:hypothetical protein EVAR_56709_1 [Eumeta japonica]|uniref:Uncharacterized protein n=1 Tax=Eumeta variegata TaxID=151549 RepID=A0A4C1Y1M0_EUMVA|nr:hypothetical protein EVAR_56709_1 [Eumeta japonica]